ncbi:hypothetical protein N0V90_010000 [Kalmusia sp. IMI 367209]|nr:hypothetical protein N0V90_010000 [Kalmusia sp. IMI 367209]
MDMALRVPEAYSWHLPEIFMVLMGCHLLQTDFSRRILDAAASKKLIQMNPDTQQSAVIRIVGLVHSLAVSLASICLLLTNWRPFLNLYSPYFVMYQLSNPFLQIHWFCDTLGWTGSSFQVYNGIVLLVVFFTTRIGGGTYATIRMLVDVITARSGQLQALPVLYAAKDKNDSSQVRFEELANVTGPISTTTVICILSAILTLEALNIYWLGKLIHTVRRRIEMRAEQIQKAGDKGLTNGINLVVLSAAVKVLWNKALFALRDMWISASLGHFARSGGERVLPSTEQEAQMQRLWADVLTIPAEQIGTSDNFFHLGGNSLQAVTLVAKGRAAGLEINVMDIFTSSTMADLARLTKVCSNGDSISDPRPFELIPAGISVEGLVVEVAALCKTDQDDIEDVSVCTPMQEGLMSISVGTDLYVARHVIALEPSARVDQILSALNMLFQLVPIFRTRIVQSESSGRLLQVVVKDRPQWQRASNLEEHLESDRQYPMGFGDALMRFAIIQNPVTRQRQLVWTAHHALYDGWSLSLVARFLVQVHQGIVPPLPPRFTRFVKYIAQANEGDKARNFWQSRLSDTAPSVFPAIPAPRYQPRADSVYTLRIESRRPRNTQITTATIIQAAWGLLMNRYEGGDSVTFGLTVAGRNASLPGIEDVLGPTIATVPTRVQFDRKKTLQEYLQSVQDSTTEMIPFEQFGMQNIMTVDAATRSACQFQNLLIIQPKVWSNELKGIGSATLDYSPQLANDKAFPLVLECTLEDASIEIRASFDSTIVQEAQVTRAVAQLEHVISQMLDANESIKIGTIETVSPADKIDIMCWNASLPDSVNACVHDLITRKVQQYPQKVAISGWDGTFTYGDLDRLSSELAAYLIGCGIGPETSIPILFEKSSWTVVAMLGALKAGGICAALNPKHPQGRLQGIIKQLSASIILSSEANQSLLDGGSVKIIPVGPSTDAWKKQGSSASEKISVNPSNAAFIVFTSGSTGVPKGIVLEHRAFCTSARAHGAVMRLGPDSRSLQFASYTFDVSLGEIFTTLMYGGCVCVPCEEERMNDLASAIMRMDVNWAYLTPSVANLLNPADVSSLKTLSLGGEAVSQGVVAKWADNVHLINIYGPAETTVWSSALCGLKPDTSPENLGRGVGSLSWVVDTKDHDILAPIGAIGELLLEGPILARGYLNDEEKTHASFIYDPAWSQGFGGKGRRFYKTGDLVRYNADGTIAFAGRRDNQVKLRGQRIEMGEVEHHLSTSAFVQHAVVTVPKIGPYLHKLVAVLSLQDVESSNVIGSEEQSITLVQSSTLPELLPQIQDHVSSRVPPYMVPTAWIFVHHIPLLVSGKLNRKEVLRWVDNLDEETEKGIDHATRESEDLGRPLSLIEKQLVDIWTRVLDTPADRICLNRSFMSLRGDSMSAMQVVALSRQQGISTTFAEVLHSTSIAALAERIEKTGANQFIFAEEAVEKPFQLSPIQQLFFDLVPEGENHFNQSALFRISRPVTLNDMNRALEAVVGQHSMLRARFQKAKNGVWTQMITGDVRSSYRVIESILYADEEIPALVAESQTKLDIETGPLITVDLVRIGQEQRCLFSAHHLVIDLVSWRILLEDLGEVLQSGSLHSDKPISFQVWQHMQREYASEHLPPSGTGNFAVPVEAYSYWGLDGPGNKYQGSVTARFTLDAEKTAVLLGPANEALRTQPLDILLSSLTHSFLEIFTNRQPPTIFNEGHGREAWDESIDLPRTIGWFTTIAPIAVTVEKGQSLIETVRRTKDARRSLKTNGWSYFASRYLHPNGREVSGEYENMEVLFNYAGVYRLDEAERSIFQQPQWVDASISNGIGVVSGKMRRTALFDITAVVEEGKMQITVTYNKDMKYQDQICSWIAAYERVLCKTIQTLGNMELELTSSDFPLLELTSSDLKTLVDERLPHIGIRHVSEVEDVYPCSPMQTNLLLGGARRTGNYEVRLIWEIAPISKKTEVTVDRVANAWQQVVNRHPILRTTIVDAVCDDRLFDQVVARTPKARIVVLDAHQDAFSALEAQHPMKFTGSGLPHQLVLCQNHAGSVFCKLEISHVVIDGTSLPILQQELLRAYNGALSETPGSKYSGFIEYINNRDSEKDLTYWTDYLRGIEPCHFPTLNENFNNPRTMKTITVNIDSSAELIAACEAGGVTVPNLIQTAWALVLRAYAATDKVCFGYLTSGRDIPVPDIEEAVGLFINMLVYRLDVTPTMTLAEVMAQLQESFTKSLDHQGCSLGQIQKALNMSNQNLFNSIVSCQVYPSKTAALSGGDIVFRGVVGRETTEYDVSVNVRQFGREEVQVSLSHWESHISEGLAVHVASTFSKAIDSLVQTPHLQIGDLDLVDSFHKRSMQEWNKEGAQAVDGCLHDIISQHAVTRADAPAVESWDGEFTYKQLDDLSTSLARHLAELGVGPETAVPLCFEKTSWVIIAMLAVLKAGGGFVPLDPTHPEERRKMIIEDLQAKILVASSAQMDICKGLVETMVEVSPQNIARMGSTHPLPRVQPRSLAYIIFTSGTTGRPKGVMIEHEAFCTSIMKHGKGLGLNSDSRVLQFVPYIYDASLTEMMGTLAHGGCVCMPSEEDRLSDIEGVINRMRITWTLLTPSVARHINPTKVPTLKHILVGGERVGEDIVSIWGHSSTTIVVAYGPTETTIISHGSTVQKLGFRADTIGRSYGCTSWIADINDPQRLLPVGCVGELLIGGPILARMYLNNREKTDASFIEKPVWAKDFAAGPARVYRSGDLMQFNADGTMHYVGRKDQQVKLRGQRFELAEVEHNLQRLAPKEWKVAAQVIQPKHRGGDAMLAGFVSVDNKTYQDDLALDVFAVEMVLEGCSTYAKDLAQWMPSYMIPTIYIPLEHMPLTAAGKTDRRKLREFGNQLTAEDLLSCSVRGKERREITDPREKQLQSLWVKCLRLDIAHVKSNSHFIELGGDSIAAVRLVAAAREQGITLTVPAIFDHPVLADMALRMGHISEFVHVQPFSLLPSSEIESIKGQAMNSLCGSTAIDDIYPSSPLQEGLMALSVKRQGAYIVQIPFRLPSDIDIMRFQRSWSTVIREVPILRTRLFESPQNGLLQAVLIDEPANWKLCTDFDTYLAEDRETAMGTGDPLTRYACVKLPDGANLFVWTLHHAIYDGWMLPLVLEMVENQYRTGQASAFTPFNTFIQSLQDGDEAESNAFWTSELSGGSGDQFPRLPSENYQPASDSRLDRHCQVPGWDQTKSDSFTQSTFIRAAWSLVVAQYSNSDDFVYGLTVNGRNMALLGVDRILGPTLNTVPVRARIDGAKSVDEYLQACQEQATRMMKHEQTGLQQIQHISPEIRAASAFQNILVIQQQWDISQDSLLFREPIRIELPNGFFENPLVVECGLTESGIKISAHFDSSVIAPSQMERILRHFEHTLCCLVLGDRTQLVDSVCSINPHDVTELVAWNGDCPEMINTCIHDIIAEQALANPDKEAVCAWDVRFTYVELDRISSFVAQRLRAASVGPNVFVPLCFDKSGWTVVTMLAVLKAGGACIALDPKHPIARLEGLVRDCRATVAATAPEHAELISRIVDQVIIVDSAILKDMKGSSTTMPLGLNHRAQPDSPAFILFTSGSTGVPKGIIIEHRAMSSSVHSHALALRIGPDSRVFQFSAYTYDVSNGEIFTTLMVGGTVCVPSPEDRFNNMAKAINDLQVNWSFLTPTVAELLQAGEVPTLKTLALGGEHATYTNISRWHDKLCLINTYGPAECSIWCSCRPGLQHDADPANIGHPVGASLWIANVADHNKLVPIGCVGELLVEGPTLARGYLNDSTKTQAAFITNPTWTTILPGGISFAARKDTQVKLRGQRLELGEVEHHVQRLLPAHWQSAAQLIHPKYRQGEGVLACFICPGSNSVNGSVDLHLSAMPTIARRIPELEQGLMAQLAPYMLPSAYIPLRAFPITANGKTDRRLLLQLGEQLTAEELTSCFNDKIPKRAPSSPMEVVLQELWADILHLNRSIIGADDNFINSGGDSVRAMQLVAMARYKGIRLTVATIFQNPTLSKMALSCERIMESDDGVSTVIEPYAPLQEGLMALSLKENGAYMMQSCHKLSANLDVSRFQQAWARTREDMGILRTRFIQASTDGFLQVVVRTEMQWSFSDDLNGYLAADCQTPVRLGDELARYALINTNESIYLVFTAHHGLYDGWTLAMIFDRIQCYYEEDMSPAPLQDYNIFISNVRATEQDEAARGFWQSQIINNTSNYESFPPLPHPQYQPVADSSVRHRALVSWDARSTVTASNIVRGAWALTLAQYSGSTNVTFGSTLSGRNVSIPGIEVIAGPTLTTVPIAVQTANFHSVTEYLDALQQQSVNMMPFEQTGLLQIKQYLDPASRAACIFHNILVVQAQIDVSPESTWFASQVAQDSQGFGFFTHPLTVECTITEAGIDVNAYFDSHVLATQQAEHILYTLAHILRQLVQNTSLSMRDIEMISPEGLSTISLYNSECPLPVNESVVSLIQNTAEQHSKRPAVEAWDDRFSYYQLDQLSTALAYRLVSLGVKANDSIPLCFEKSAWYIVAALAVLKAGGAFVFLDPLHSAERRKGIVLELGPKVILASPSLLNTVEGLVSQVESVSSSDIRGLSHTTMSALPEIPLDSLAYFIFTSGSTGKPKGVMIPHKSIASSILAHGRALRITSSSRVLQHSSYAFDASILEILTTLSHGGCVCIPTEEEKLNNIEEVANRMTANWALFTSSFAQLIDPSRLTTLKIVVFGGEPVGAHVMEAWEKHTTVICAYGPSETSVVSHASRPQDDTSPGRKSNNIGYSAGCISWVVDVDDNDRLVPLGCTGELLIQGPIVGLGYYRNEEKTREAFIQAPSWTAKYPAFRHDQPFYLTGDLVCYNLDGSLSIRGRKDGQVKLHGQRLELGEVEHQMRRLLPDTWRLASDVISPRSENNNLTNDNAALAVFISAEEESDRINTVCQQIQGELKAVLPPYMVPSLYIPVTQLPLTRNGKIDRRALRDIGEQLAIEELVLYRPSADNDAQYKRAALSPAELRLRNLWSQVLQIECTHITADDNFFQLGGNSVKAIRLVAIARGQRISLTIADIFKCATLADLALATRRKEDEEQTENAVVPFSLLKLSGSIESIRQRCAELCGVHPSLGSRIYIHPPLSSKVSSQYLRKKAGPTLLNNHSSFQSLSISPNLNKPGPQPSRRPPVLRTRIVYTEECGLVQVIIDEPISWIDSNLEDRTMAITLGRPLTSYAIVENATGEGKTFVWSAHHSVYDAWTVRLVLESVEAAYLGAQSLPLLPYSHFIKAVTESSFSETQDFWRLQLAGAANNYEPFPSPPTGTHISEHAIRHHSAILPWATNQSLTASTFIRAAWALVVAEYSGAQEDVVFGVTISGRNASLPGIERLAGPTINTVPLRVQCPRSQSVQDYIESIQKQSVEMINHEHMGLQQIQQLGSEFQDVCNFQNILVIQDASVAAVNESFLFNRPSAADEAGFFTNPLVIGCTITDHGVDIVANYDSKILSARQMDRIIAQLELTLNELVLGLAHEQSLKDLKRLNRLDEQDIQAWNTSLIAPVNDCVDELFMRQVQESSTHIAIDAWDEKFTYSEVADLSARLAEQLTMQGYIKPEVCIPICFEKSAWAVVAMLAIIQSGAAFVPLDPSNPIERQQHILQAVEARVLLTSASLKKYCTQFSDVIEVSRSTLTQEPPMIAQKTVKSPALNDLAYVIFTSGSTGVPKGVMVHHQAFATSLVEHGKLLHLSPSNRVLQFAAYSFDVSLAEVFATLIYGGCVCIPPESERMNNLAAFIRAKKVTWACLPPAMASLIHPSEVPSLRALAISGEAPTREILDTWSSCLDLHNLYGPTETTIWSVMANKVKVTDAPTMIGRSVGSTAWIVDPYDYQQLIPVGCAGEMLIEGPILARGYINDQAKTDAAFITGPSWAPGRRFYKTGDLVRYNPDGTIHYIGRKDTQSKLHGKRLELGEIEHHLRKLLMNDWKILAEIVLRGRRPVLTVFLCIWPDRIVTGGEIELDLTAKGVLGLLLPTLQKELVKVLPRHMIPSLYVPIKAVPLTSPGKLNRKSLKEFGASLSADQVKACSLQKENDHSEPAFPTEKQLQRLWGKCLQLEPKSIGVQDNFFELGGDSIGGIRLVAAAREEGMALTVADIFEYPTLSEMATRMVKLPAGDVSSGPTHVEPFSQVDAKKVQSLRSEAASACGVAEAVIEDIYPCTPLQKGLIALTAKQSRAYVVQNTYMLPKEVDVVRFQRAWEATIISTPILRTRIIGTEDEGFYQVVISDEIIWPTATDIDTYLKEDQGKPMGLAKPLQRFVMVGRKFIWTAHHAIYDGWSMKLIFETIEKNYWQLSTTPSPPYSFFIQGLMKMNQETTASFWRAHLKDASSIQFPALPSSHYQVSADSKMVHLPSNWSWRLNPDLTQSSLIRAAWALLVMDYSQSTDTVFGVTLNGRNSAVPGIEQIVGPTINTVPVHVSVDRTWSVRDYLRAVQRQAIEMMPFEQTGLREIADQLGPTYRAITNFQNLLVVQSQTENGQDNKSSIFSNISATANQTAGFFAHPLTIECTIGGETLEMAAYFDSQLISTDQMKRILQQFEHIIRQLMLVGGDKPISAVGTISPADFEELQTWNIPLSKSTDSCVHHIIRKQVRSRPEAEAICAWDVTLTYRELDTLSTHLAHQLVSYGVGPETLVPLCFEKSGWTVVAMLAILKAGGACVGLEPRHPTNRLKSIIRDCKPPVVLAAPSCSAIVAPLVDSVLVVDPSLFEGASAREPPRCEVKPENPIFVLFTSGSTGTPKGIVLEHRALCSSACCHAPALGIDEDSRVLQFSSYVYDVSVGEIFTTLMVGGCVCVPSVHDRYDNLAGAINRLKVNWAFLTPTVADLLDAVEVVPQLKTLAVGGEAATVTNIAHWHDKVRFIITYGPAECAIWSNMVAGVGRDADPTNIGRRLNGCRQWVVDVADHHRLMPIGCPGELLIEGPIQARGYLNDPVKTAAAFVTDLKWASSPGRRFYKTGDVVRYNTDGTISFVARKDNQVKFRGQRLELGEVEHHLKKLSPSEWQVAVQIIQPFHRDGDPLLAGFISCEDKTSAENELEFWESRLEDIHRELVKIEAGLASTLAQWMIPSVYIPINFLPVNTSGEDRPSSSASIRSPAHSRTAGVLFRQPK